MNNKLVILDAKTIGSESTLQALFSRFGDLTIWQTTSRDERLSHIGDASIIITNKVLFDKEIIDKCPNLRLICLTATGMNNVDLDYAAQKNIVVKNVTGYSTNSVAQFTFAMLFHLMSHTAYYDNFVKSGAYSNLDVFTHFGPGYWELNGKRWGIIGLGAIGQKVAHVAAAFGADVVYYSTSGRNDNSTFKRVELPELLATSRVVSIHAPLNDNTRGLIGAAQLSCMRKDAILINVGRGHIVEENALAWAIDHEIIWGACLDVMAVEPLPAHSPLLSIKNKERLCMSPHVAWISQEALQTLLLKTVDNIATFLAG
jgi:glycerate dehydrogenase